MPKGEHGRPRGSGAGCVSLPRSPHKTGGRSGGRSDEASEPPELPRRVLRYSEVCRRLVPYTFLETIRSSKGETKNHFPRSGRNGQLSRTIPDGFPHWLKLQHRAP